MRKVWTSLGLLFLCGCSHYPDVKPNEDSGIHRVSFLVSLRGDGTGEAMKQAERYCEAVHQNHAVRVRESTEYVGNTDEQTYLKAKEELDREKPHGLVGKIVEKKNEAKKGSAVMVDDSKADAVATKGYEYAMEFRCQAS